MFWVPLTAYSKKKTIPRFPGGMYLKFINRFQHTKTAQKKPEKHIKSSRWG